LGFASRILNCFSPSLQRELLDGTIGSGAAAEFVGFLKLQEQIPSIDKIFAGENIVPKDIGLKYALVFGRWYLIVKRPSNTTDCCNTVSRYPKSLRYCWLNF